MRAVIADFWVCCWFAAAIEGDNRLSVCACARLQLVRCLSRLNDAGLLSTCMTMSCSALAIKLTRAIASVPVGVSPLAVQLANEVLELAMGIGAGADPVSVGRVLLECLLDTEDAAVVVSVWAPSSVIGTTALGSGAAAGAGGPAARAGRSKAGASGAAAGAGTGAGTGSSGGSTKESKGAVFYVRHRAAVDAFLLRADVWPVLAPRVVDAVCAVDSGHNQPWFVMASMLDVMVEASRPSVPVRGGPAALARQPLRRSTPPAPQRISVRDMLAVLLEQLPKFAMWISPEAPVSASFSVISLLEKVAKMSPGVLVEADGGRSRLTAPAERFVRDALSRVLGRGAPANVKVRVSVVGESPSQS